MAIKKEIEFSAAGTRDSDNHKTVTRNEKRWVVTVGAGETVTINHSADENNLRRLVIDDNAFTVITAGYSETRTKESTLVTFTGAGTFGISLEV